MSRISRKTPSNKRFSKDASNFLRSRAKSKALNKEPEVEPEIKQANTKPYSGPVTRGVSDKDYMDELVLDSYQAHFGESEAPWGETAPERVYERFNERTEKPKKAPRIVKVDKTKAPEITITFPENVKLSFNGKGGGVSLVNGEEEDFWSAEDI